jgi:hypothetical protein
VSERPVPHDIDALFKLPLGEFIAGRNALASQLKKAGREAEASKTKALVKPSASAWVVNQLVFRHRQAFDRLIDAGERLRRAHAARLTGDAARNPVNARREVMTELTAIAEKILREGGHNTTRDLMRRVTTTLEALSSYGSLAGAPVAGHLTDDLEPPGFEAVAGLLPERAKGAARAPIQMRLPQAERAPKPARAASGDDSARRDKEERKRLVVAAKTAVRVAERNLSVAHKQAERAAVKAETAARRAKAIDGQREEIEKQLTRATKEAEAARAHANETATDSEAASQAAESAERALEVARGRLVQSADDKS